MLQIHPFHPFKKSLKYVSCISKTFKYIYFISKTFKYISFISLTLQYVSDIPVMLHYFSGIPVILQYVTGNPMIFRKLQIVTGNEWRFIILIILMFASLLITFGVQKYSFTAFSSFFKMISSFFNVTFTSVPFFNVTFTSHENASSGNHHMTENLLNEVRISTLFFTVYVLVKCVF